MKTAVSDYKVKKDGKYKGDKKMELFGQIISVVAMVAIVLSFQCKSNRNLALVSGTGAGLFALSYFMLAQPSAAVYNIISAVVSIMCLKKSFKTKLNFGISTVVFIIATYFTYENWWSLILMTAVIGSAYCIILKSGSFIRKLRLFYISPIWLINNTIMCFTIGGIICEVITMISVIVSFIRYRKTGFED